MCSRVLDSERRMYILHGGEHDVFHGEVTRGPRSMFLTMALTTISGCYYRQALTRGVLLHCLTLASSCDSIYFRQRQHETAAEVMDHWMGLPRKCGSDGDPKFLVIIKQSALP